MFWKGKKVLITGHTGFKGSWLSLWLMKLDADVVGVSLEPPTTPSLFSKARVFEGITDLRADVRDADRLKQIFQEQQPEIVFHLAAQPLVRYSYDFPVETYETNVMGTLNVLEGIRSVDSVKAVVLITTDKCYENREWVWGYRENEAMGGYDPYSSSKGAAELLIASYRNSYFSAEKYEQHKTAIASTRAGNVIGGGDWAMDRLIPDILTGFLNDEVVNIRSPFAIRPWQHVLESLKGYIVLAEKLYKDGTKYAGAWNFGPLESDVRDVRWIVEYLANSWEGESRWKIDKSIQPHEANYLKLDCSKAHCELGWWPKWSVDKALDKIVEWHKMDGINADLQATCLRQIDEYENEVSL